MKRIFSYFKNDRTVEVRDIRILDERGGKSALSVGHERDCGIPRENA